MNASRLLNPLAIAIAIVAATTMMSKPAYPQEVSKPLSRAQVNAETRAFEAAHKLTPAGEGSYPVEPAGPKSTKTRADRKAETRLARKEGLLLPPGDGTDYGAERKLMATPSTRTRAERKSETRAAAKAHALVPAGEGPGAPLR